MTNQSEVSPEILEKLRSKTVYGYISYFEMVSGWSFPEHMFPVALALCDERIKKLLIMVGPGSTKSTHLSIYFPSWKLGHDQSQTILGISASEGLIQGFVQGAMEIIEWSPWWKIAFPGVIPDKDSGWSPARGIYVNNRPIGLPDPSYVGVGLTSKALTGKHAKTIIIDDIHDDENSYTAEGRKRVVDKYYSQLVGRADPSGARYVIAGRRWALGDLYGWLMEKESEDWVTMVLPAERKQSTRLFWDITVPNGLECCFTENETNA